MTNFNDTVPDYLRVIRLGCGPGGPGQSACWMTALQAHMNGEWTDQCSCVDPVINTLCIHINDSYADDNEARTKDIMNFGLFRVLGTNGTEEDTHKRKMHLTNVLIREWFLSWLKSLGVKHRIIIPEFYCKEDVGRFDLVAEVHGYLTKQAEPFFLEILSVFAGAFRTFADTGRVEYLLQFLLTFYASLHPHVLFPQIRVDGFEPLYLGFEKYFLRGTISTSEIAQRRSNYLRNKVYPLLADLITMGPHGPIEQDLPVCGVKTFHKKVGVQHADYL